MELLAVGKFVARRLIGVVPTADWSSPRMYRWLSRAGATFGRMLNE